MSNSYIDYTQFNTIGTDASRAKRSAYEGITGLASTFWGSPVLQRQDGTLYCPGYMGNTYASSQWDFVVIGNFTTPGIARLTCDKQREVDKKKVKGADGARITLAGLEPAKVEIRLTIWTPEQLKQLDILRAQIFPGPQKKSTVVTTGGIAGSTSTFTANPYGNTTTQDANGNFKTQRNYNLNIVPQVSTIVRKTVTKSTTVTQPFACTHPVLKTYGVNSLLFIRTEGPTEGDVPGSKIYTLHAMEFSLPKKGVNSTVTPTSSVPKGSTLDPSNAQTPGTNPANLGP